MGDRQKILPTTCTNEFSHSGQSLNYFAKMVSLCFFLHKAQTLYVLSLQPQRQSTGRNETYRVCKARSLSSRIYFQTLLMSLAEKEKAWVLPETLAISRCLQTPFNEIKCSDNHLLSALSSLINGNLPIFQPIYL